MCQNKEYSKTYVSCTLSKCYDVIEGNDKKFMSYQTFLSKIKARTDFNKIFGQEDHYLFSHSISGDVFGEDEPRNFFIYKAKKI